jgi:hypothetical protein
MPRGPEREPTQSLAGMEPAPQHRGLPHLQPAVLRYLTIRRVALEGLSTNNEIAGFKFATVGVLYAVLVACAIIYRDRLNQPSLYGTGTY